MLHRAFWTSKTAKTDFVTPDGINPYCVHIFLKCVRSYVEAHNPTNIYIVWDKRKQWPSTNFRKTTMEGEYKSTRVKHDGSVFLQEEIIENMCAYLGVKNMYPYVLEADDVIAWLTTKIQPNLIMTVDSDLMQLVNENTSVYHLNKKTVINNQNFEEYTKVPLNAFLYYKAILGDTADNIPGFPGFGKIRSKKLATDLAAAGGDIEKISLSEEYQRLFKKNMTLMDLKIGYTIEDNEISWYSEQFEKLKNHTSNFNMFESNVDILGLKSIKNDIKDWEAVFTLRKT